MSRLAAPARILVRRILELLRDLTEIEHRVNMLYMKVERRRLLLEQLLETFTCKKNEKGN